LDDTPYATERVDDVNSVVIVQMVNVKVTPLEDALILHENWEENDRQGSWVMRQKLVHRGYHEAECEAYRNLDFGKGEEVVVVHNLLEQQQHVFRLAKVNDE